VWLARNHRTRLRMYLQGRGPLLAFGTGPEVWLTLLHQTVESFDDRIHFLYEVVSPLPVQSCFRQTLHLRLECRNLFSRRTIR